MEKLYSDHSTHFSDASVMVRHVEYPNFYSPLHRFHHFWDINTSVSLANLPCFGPLLGLSARARTQQSGRVFNESGVMERQVARRSAGDCPIYSPIGQLRDSCYIDQSQHSLRILTNKIASQIMNYILAAILNYLTFLHKNHRELSLMCFTCTNNLRILSYKRFLGFKSGFMGEIGEKSAIFAPAAGDTVM